MLLSNEKEYRDVNGFIGDPCSGLQSPTCCYSAGREERAGDKTEVQQGSRLTGNKRARSSRNLGVYSRKKTVRALQMNVRDIHQEGKGL